MKRYVVTDEQLDNLADMAVKQWESGLNWGRAFKECRLIEVPEKATHFSCLLDGEDNNKWMLNEDPSIEVCDRVRRVWEIQK